MRKLIVLALVILGTIAVSAPVAAGNSWSARHYTPTGVEWTR